jgi:hypothetical protein
MANFPTSISTNANLYVAVNGLQTTLAVGCTDSDTTLTLTSTTGFPTTGFVTIDNSEIVAYTGILGSTITGCTRGADGTTAASHLTGVTVGLTIVAAHHNLLKDEVIALETSLGAGFAKGNLTSTVGTDGITVTGGTGAVIGSGTSISQQASTDSLPGYLTSADHTSFAGAVTTANNALPKSGGTMTGDITMDNNKSLILKETTGNGTDAITVKAPASVTSSYTITLPPAVASAGQSLKDVAGNGILSWASTTSALVVSVKDYGAVGDDTTDDTAAIQAAINAAGEGMVFFPAGSYKISSQLNMTEGVVLQGCYTSGFTTGSSIRQTGSAPVIYMANRDSTGQEQQRSAIRGLLLRGGTRGIYAENGGVGVTIRDVLIYTPSAECILLRGFNQEWYFEDVELIGGTYGIKMDATGLQTDHSTLGTAALFDKNHFYSVYIHGQSENGLFIYPPSPGTGNHNTFIDLRLVGIQKDGAILKGAMTGTQIIGLSTELVGVGSPTFAQSTATTSSGSANVTIAAASNFVDGQVVTIAGAGTNGTDWYPTISSGGGTTSLVMTTTAPATVTTADIVNALYSELVIGGGAAATQTFIIQNFLTTSATTRYAVDAGSAGSGVTVIDMKNSRPVYDPTSVVVFLGTAFTVVRPTSDIVGSYIESVFGNVASGSSGVFSDSGSIVITPGSWDITFVAVLSANVAGTMTVWSTGISTTSGNSTSGLVSGSNYLNLMPAIANSAVTNDGRTIANWRKTVSVPTTIYAKTSLNFTTGTWVWFGRLSAVKITV